MNRRERIEHNLRVEEIERRIENEYRARALPAKLEAVRTLKALMSKNPGAQQVLEKSDRSG